MSDQCDSGAVGDHVMADESHLCRPVITRDAQCGVAVREVVRVLTVQTEPVVVTHYPAWKPAFLPTVLNCKKITSFILYSFSTRGISNLPKVILESNYVTNSNFSKVVYFR